MQANDNHSDDSGMGNPSDDEQGVVQEGQGEALVEVGFVNFLILLVPRHLRPSHCRNAKSTF